MNPDSQRIPAVRLLLSVLVVTAFGLAIYRFARGLGASTNLDDMFPWGLWIAFDMLSGVALAAGGFVLAGTVYIFGLKKFAPFVRPAIATALLGYLLAIIGLVMDLGRPWAIWHPLIMWQPHSVMFEVAWCVVLYTTVLVLEFLPIVFERFRMEKSLRFIGHFTMVFVIAGIILSTMHQSSLGTLFVMMEHRMHPLWFTPMLPLLFFATAVAVGIAMVIFEAIISGIIFGHRYPVQLLGDLAKALPPLLGLYIGLKLMDLNARGVLPLLFDGSFESWAMMIELLFVAVLPGPLLLSPKVRYNYLMLFSCVLMVIIGVVLNRLNVCLVAMLATSPNGYLPSWIEILVTAGVISGGLLVLSLMNQTLPIVSVPPTQAESRPSHVAGPTSLRTAGGS